MPLQWFLQWWNLAFIVPFLLALFYLLIYAASGLTFGEADAHAEGGADGHGDLDADAHAEVDAHADVDAHAEVAADATADAHVDGAPDVHLHDGDGAHAEPHGAHDGHGHGDYHADGADGPSFLVKALGWLGLGRVPLSIVLMLLMISWGAIGFLINYLLASSMPVEWEWMVVLISLPAAALGSTTFTHTAVRALARWMPTTETSALPRAKLVASAAQALYPIDEKFGLASVRTRDGDLFQVACRTYEGRPPIAKGKRLLLVDYDEQKEVFYVVPNDLEL
jgi:hypothetical protein